MLPITGKFDNQTCEKILTECKFKQSNENFSYIPQIDLLGMDEKVSLELNEELRNCLKNKSTGFFAEKIDYKFLDNYKSLGITSGNIWLEKAKLLQETGYVNGDLVTQEELRLAEKKFKIDYGVEVIETILEKAGILQETGYLNNNFTQDEFHRAEKKFKHDYDVQDISDISYYLGKKDFISNFNRIGYDKNFQGEINIKTRNIKDIYYQDFITRGGLLSREIKTYDNHKTHFYVIHTKAGAIKLKLMKNEHAVIFFIRIENAA
jgi:hypothetical protein